jgi:hypothetical protein
MARTPMLTDEHRRLHAFVGEWRGEEVLADSRWMRAGRAVGVVSAAADLGGFYVAQTYRQEREGVLSFEARGLFGYDADDRHCKLYWFDSLGFVPPAPASGVWKGDTLTLVRASFHGAARHMYQFQSADRYSVRIDYAWEGETWEEVLTGNYQRA